jgi:hypothetical protein
MLKLNHLSISLLESLSYIISPFPIWKASATIFPFPFLKAGFITFHFLALAQGFAELAKGVLALQHLFTSLFECPS